MAQRTTDLFKLTITAPASDGEGEVRGEFDLNLIQGSSNKIFLGAYDSLANAKGFAQDIMNTDITLTWTDTTGGSVSQDLTPKAYNDAD